MPIDIIQGGFHSDRFLKALNLYTSPGNKRFFHAVLLWRLPFQPASSTVRSSSDKHTQGYRKKSIKKRAGTLKKARSQADHMAMVAYYNGEPSGSKFFVQPATCDLFVKNRRCFPQPVAGMHAACPGQKPFDNLFLHSAGFVLA
jgi:hypothetical protein